MAEINLEEWDSFLAHYPNAHILQSPAWGQLKADFGWQVTHVVLPDCGAQLLIKQILPGIRFAYIPKGPVGINWHKLWSDMDELCRHFRCIFLKIEPDSWISDDNHFDSSSIQIPDNFIQSQHNIQPLRTLMIDISGEESQILGRMKQKTRYNINL